MRNLMLRFRKSWKIVVAQLLIFICLLIYFIKITPLIPFDGDDWNYIGTMRTLPFPIWGAWNPTRVLPEILSPISGYIAAYIVYPLFGHYLYSIMVVHSLIVSSFCLIFFFCFFKLLRKRFRLDVNGSLAIEISLFLSFFLIFKHVNAPSYSAFWTMDFDCVFFYLVPGLINGSLLFYMMGFSNYNHYVTTQSIQYRAIFFLCLYFAIFSSTQFNIIIATYSFLHIVQTLLHYINDKFNFRKYILSTYIDWIILITWFLSVVFDINGGRSDSVSSNLTVHQLFTEVGHNIVILLNRLNLKIAILYLILGCAGLCLNYSLSKKGNLDVFINVILMFVLITAYLILAYLKAGTAYIARIDAMWAAIIMLLIFANLGLATIIYKYKKVKVFVPWAIIMGTLVAFNFNYQPIQPNSGNHNVKSVINVDNFIINQVITADREGKGTVVVDVPWEGKNSPNNPASNWPHSYAMADELSNTLFIHQIIHKKIHVVFHPQRQLNKKFY